MIVAPLFLEHTKIKTADLLSEFFCVIIHIASATKLHGHSITKQVSIEVHGLRIDIRAGGKSGNFDELNALLVFKKILITMRYNVISIIRS